MLSRSNALPFCCHVAIIVILVIYERVWVFGLNIGADVARVRTHIAFKVPQRQANISVSGIKIGDMSA